MVTDLPKISFDKDSLSDFERSLSLEWIMTNGLGGYSSSTILGINTRKYHGLLVASFNPPVDRMVMLSKLDEQLLIDDETFPLGSSEFGHGMHQQGYKYLESFSQSPFPTFVYKTNAAELRKTVIMPNLKNGTVIFYEIFSPTKAVVQISPLVNSRHFHAVTNKPDWSFVQNVSQQKTTLETTNPQSALTISSSSGRYISKKEKWVEGVFLRADSSYGTSCFDDYYVPGQFEVDLKPGEETHFCIVATAGKSIDDADDIYLSMSKDLTDFKRFYQKEADRLEALLTKFYDQHPSAAREDWAKCLILATDSFVVDRSSTKMKSVIAGYHWFEDWGRDALISLPGLTLVTGHLDAAREILLTFKHYCKHGIVPNRFPDEAGEKPDYNTVDATLWYLNAVLQYLKYTDDFNFVKQELWLTLRSVIDYYIQGTINNIHADNDGLIIHGARLTWMDAMIDSNPITSRQGKAVEIQSLWFNGLKTMELIASRFGQDNLAEQYRNMARKTRRSFVEKFWNLQSNCLFDVIDNKTVDVSLRPNQVIAVSLDFSMLDEAKQEAVVSVLHKKLWTPYGLRTLPPDDPKYRGKYSGDWANRNLSYHNGTAWLWLIGPFVTAFLKTKKFHVEWRNFAFQHFLLPILREQLLRAGLGTLSEVFDGDWPHSPGGCISQAWSVAEFLRAYVEDVLFERPSFERTVLEEIPSQENK